MKRHISLLLICSIVAFSIAHADGPEDNLVQNVRPIPPPGVEVPAIDKDALNKGLAELRLLIDEVIQTPSKNPKFANLIPDVEIYHKSVDWALRYNMIYKPEEIKMAYDALTDGKARAESLKKGAAPWTNKKGLVVRAYRSKIDGSIQPYGLVIPESYSGGATRLDIWCHGRGETLSELGFVGQRTKQVGQIQPANSIVLHLYGRYCCANKFAGEVDAFEALDHVRKYYNINNNQVVMRGFSMGGAAAWQFATHFPDQWCAASPGAGFAETPEFLNVFQTEDVSKVPWYQKKLWGWYNATDYALNLFNCPTIAYSGELDKQKQAADVMERELKKVGLNMLHIIGPQTAHKIHPDSLIEIEQRLAAITAQGRDRAPKEVHFTTMTLRYNQSKWITVDGMEEHWEKSRVDASITSENALKLQTHKVTALTVKFASGTCPLNLFKKVAINIDGAEITTESPKSDRSYTASLSKVNGKWQLAADGIASDSLAKRHGMSGPIDDAFMDAFLFVTPTGAALNPQVEKWVASELPRAVTEWQKQFRGDAPRKKDAEVKDEDIAKNNLVLWGDPSSNAVLKKIVDKLPIQWTAENIVVGDKKYAAGEHVPVLIYPNPLNPKKYVVINSSFTYREYDYLNNARQVPKLPDWAIVNLSQAPDAVNPGKIVDAGFFNEQWALKKSETKE